VVQLASGADRAKTLPRRLLSNGWYIRFLIRKHGVAVKTKTSELIGLALEWAVASIECPDDMPALLISGDFEFSTAWAQGGPIIEREGIAVVKFYEPVDGPVSDGCEWAALTLDDSTRRDGPTPLVASMRCYVASKLGDEVDVPDELAQDISDKAQ
jgi:Protein of unknown function (DUF2591)